MDHNTTNGQSKKFQGKQFHRGRRQKEVIQSKTTISQNAAQPQAHAVENQKVKPWLKARPPLKKQVDPFIELIEDDDEQSFPQAIQARAREIDDDSQLSQLYWVSLGIFENDTQALLNSHW